ncbi:hypothetical protein ACOI1C_22090 [Bacillus sp. DJP31]|uniref:hypothetical protein n=1 Tax=Bacillus sp. DJP31 TaxID=3409789 RepID=UPI003BB4EAAA
MHSMDLQPITLSNQERERLQNLWKVMQSAIPIVQRIYALSSQLRIHPESSHVDGMILYYRAVSELAYGHARAKGGIRRAYNGFYSHEVQKNMVMWIGGYRQFSQQTTVLLDNVSNNVNGSEAKQIIQQLNHSLQENDKKVRKALSRAKDFFGQEQFKKIQMEIMKDMTITSNPM